MSAAVPHILLFVFGLVKKTDVAEKLSAVAVNFLIAVSHGKTGLEDFKEMVGGSVSAFVKSTLTVGEFTVAGPAAGNVRVHMVVLAANVVEDHITVLDQKKKARSFLPTEAVVLAMGVRPNNALEKALTEKGIKTVTVGDASKGGTIGHAVHDAFNKALLI